MRTLLLAIALVLAATGTAEAYPAFQLSTGAQRCNQCHIAPAGGTLINNYGRDESADTISRGGDGGFLHGAWSPPDWLALGGDLRSAAVVDGGSKDFSPTLHMFPMQADLYAAAKSGPITFALAVGYRGSARGQHASTLDRLGFRDLYLMWRPKSQGAYVRAGKFMAPMGLRLVEHPAYVRRYGGTNYGEEPLAVSGGVVKNAAEWHLTLHTKDPLRCYGLGCAEIGAVGFYERRLGEKTAVGALARWAEYDPGDDAVERTIHAGLIAKHWLEGPGVLFLAHLEGGAKMTAADYTNKELLGHLGATWFAVKGVLITGTAETFVEDVVTPGVGRYAGTLQVQYFPWAHIELVLYGRAASGYGLGMFQLHYYL